MRDPVFKNVNYTVGALIQSIAHGKIGLPDIQRPFVWKNVKVRDLFDSLYKGYPIGYLLFWESGLSEVNKSIGVDLKSHPPSLVIVDGQQRLTSLYAVIRGEPIVKANYKIEPMRIAFNPLEEVFEVTSAAIERDKTFIPDISKLWQGQTNLFGLANEYMSGLRSTREVSSEEERSIQNAISRLQNISGFPLTALELSADISEEDVADVFVRINSQGESLNQADFILTLMSVFWDEGRKELEEFCRDSRTPSLSEASPFNHFISPYPDQLLRVCVGLAFKRARLRHVYSILRGKDLTTGVFSDEGRGEQFERLRLAQTKVLNLGNWHGFMQCVKQAGYRTGQMIKSKNALLFSYTFYLIGKTEYRVREKNLRAIIAQWLFMSLVTSRYTGSPESAMESDLAMLRDVKTTEDFTSRLQHSCKVALTDDFWAVNLPNELAKSSASSPSLSAYQAALVLTDAPVLFSQFKVAEMLEPAVQGSYSFIERHHLFPKGYLATLGITETRDTNQIANYAYVERMDNAEIADQPPRDYLQLYKNEFGGVDLTHMFKANALPDKWEKMTYWTFLERRRELMAQLIRDGYTRLTSSAGPLSESTTNDTETEKINIEELISEGESDLTEFKSTLRVNMHTRKKDTRIEQAVLKTLAGFLNTEGGTLIIGIADDGTPLGIDADNFPSEDRMVLHLTNIVNERMDPSTWTAMRTNFEDHEEKRVLIVLCKKSSVPVYVRDGSEEHFLVRTGPSTTRLSVSQTQDYIKQRFG